MTKPNNLVSLTGRIVADPTIYKDSVVSLRIAVDYSGRSTFDDNRSGFFDVKYFLNNDTPNTKFIKSQLADNKMKKGSAISLVGELNLETFEHNGNKTSKVSVIADSITYSMGTANSNSSSTGNTSSSSESIEVPDTF